MNSLEQYYKTKLDWKRFELPIKVDRDVMYYKKLNEKLEEYVSFLEEKSINEKTISSTRVNIKLIQESLINYQNAKINDAKNDVLELLNNYRHNEYLITKLQKSFAIRGVAPFIEMQNKGNDDYYNELNNKSLYLFRARVGKEQFNKKDILHIPFNKRELVSTERFSIAGVPCLYLGTTSLVCWLEMGKPNDNEFNVSSFKVSETVNIIDFVSYCYFFNNTLFNCNSDKHEMTEFEKTAIEIWPLICAISFSVDDKNRKFKSEYIISQLIMQCLEDLKVDGIAYISTKAPAEHEHDRFPYYVNIAIPMKIGCNNRFDEMYRYSELCEKLTLTNPICLSEYRMIQQNSISYENESIPNFISKSAISGQPEVYFAGKSIEYKKCIFSRFDNYLVNLEHNNI